MMQIKHTIFARHALSRHDDTTHTGGVRVTRKRRHTTSSNMKRVGACVCVGVSVLHTTSLFCTLFLCSILFIVVVAVAGVVASCMEHQYIPVDIVTLIV